MVNNNLESDLKIASDVLAEQFSKTSSKDSFSPDFRNVAREKEYPDFGTTNLEYYVSLLCRN